MTSTRTSPLSLQNEVVVVHVRIDFPREQEILEQKCVLLAGQQEETPEYV